VCGLPAELLALPSCRVGKLRHGAAEHQPNPGQFWGFGGGFPQGQEAAVQGIYPEQGNISNHQWKNSSVSFTQRVIVVASRSVPCGAVAAPRRGQEPCRGLVCQGFMFLLRKKNSCQQKEMAGDPGRVFLGGGGVLGACGPLPLPSRQVRFCSSPLSPGIRPFAEGQGKFTLLSRFRSIPAAPCHMPGSGLVPVVPVPGEGSGDAR